MVDWREVGRVVRWGGRTGWWVGEGTGEKVGLEKFGEWRTVMIRSVWRRNL